MQGFSYTAPSGLQSQTPVLSRLNPALHSISAALGSEVTTTSGTAAAAEPVAVPQLSNATCCTRDGRSSPDASKFTRTSNTTPREDGLDEAVFGMSL